ncbi:RIP defective [Magnaporthiopsis poae ATCC 64411]|uniref:DNA (cytosine-5-)-methyltransferase n=1 Tax=Magnaporthiopsis poae (strain ATCC 64411 / 73-15) TaxID=644358 RepID=A0A0C4DQR5_MAGP6|nr:RIP defective [Magnaporthiopsis poae ATCC 64411]
MPPERPVVIEILDDDPAENENDKAVDRLIQLREEYGNVPHKPIKIEDESGNDDVGEGPVEVPGPVFRGGRSFIDLTLTGDDSDNEVPARHPTAGPVRPLVRPLEAHQTRLNSCVISGEAIEEGDLVELRPIEDFAGTLYDKVEFLEVRQLFTDGGKTVLRGVPYIRTRNMNALLIRKRNEVCRFLQNDESEDAGDDHGLIDVGPEDVVGWRSFIITNAPYPEFRDLANDNLLVCRWQFTISYACAADRVSETRAKAYEMRHLRASDIPKLRYRRADGDNITAWRGGKIPGGSYFLPMGRANENDDTLGELRDAAAPGTIPDGRQQQYAAADLFCGAGGTSCGMRAAGFRIEYAVDHWQHACSTYEHNFPSTVLFQNEIFDFIQNAEPMHVDVLHLSPPCQFFSPAHTKEGNNDEVNSAALFSCKAAVEKLKPRVFTLEQTFGLASARAHQGYFAALIHGFTELGYSVRWSQVPLADWDADRLGPTVTTSGVTSVHFSGTRRFTDRELACIQGFPLDFHFQGNCVKKQIGNAFPPTVVEHLFRHLRQQLRKADGLDNGDDDDSDRAAAAAGVAQHPTVKRRRRARSASTALATASERDGLKKENRPLDGSPGPAGIATAGAATPSDRPRTQKRPETIDLTLIDDRPIPIRLSPVATRHPRLQQPPKKTQAAPVIVIDSDTDPEPQSPAAAAASRKHTQQENKHEENAPAPVPVVKQEGNERDDDDTAAAAVNRSSRSSSRSSSATLLDELTEITNRYSSNNSGNGTRHGSPSRAALLGELSDITNRHNSSNNNNHHTGGPSSAAALLGELTNITNRYSNINNNINRGRPVSSSSMSSSSSIATSLGVGNVSLSATAGNSPSSSGGSSSGEGQVAKNGGAGVGKKRSFQCVDLTYDD